MKSTLYFIFTFFLSLSMYAQVGIGTTSPNGALEIASTTDGLLIPRVALTNTTTVTVATPMTSELIYNTATSGDVTPGFYYLSTATGPWIRVGGTSGWSITGNSDIVDGTNFIGTTNDVDVAFRRQGTAAGKIGSVNTSFGVGALTNSAATGENTAFGMNALNANTSGIQNVAVGFNTLTNNTGHANTSVGWSASIVNGAANNNTAFGFEAARQNTASNTTMLGFQAGRNNTGGNLTAVGFQAANSNRGQNNTAVGNLAFYLNSHAASGNNTAVGYAAMHSSQASSIVSNNTAVGYNSMNQIRTSHNAALGYNAMSQVTTGANNVAIGAGSMEQQNSSNNTAIGRSALFNTTGNNNVAIGFEAARIHGTGNNSVMIGYQATANNRTNAVVIGYQASPTANNQIQLGNGSITSARVQVAWTITSDKRFKSNINDSRLGLDFIKTLRSVSYQRNNDELKRTEYGFIAQEVEQSLLSFGDTNNGIIMKDDDGYYGVRYNDFIPITIKAVQEQQDIIESLQKQNEELMKTNAEILSRLEALENKK